MIFEAVGKTAVGFRFWKGGKRDGNKVNTFNEYL